MKEWSDAVGGESFRLKLGDNIYKKICVLMFDFMVTQTSAKHAEAKISYYQYSVVNYDVVSSTRASAANVAPRLTVGVSGRSQ
jgi:hypothetical protein